MTLIFHVVYTILLQDMLLAYLQWQSKVDSLFDRARDIVPIQSRLEKLQDSRPVVSLTDYNTNEVSWSKRRDDNYIKCTRTC